MGTKFRKFNFILNPNDDLKYTRREAILSRFFTVNVKIRQPFSSSQNTSARSVFANSKGHPKSIIAISSRQTRGNLCFLQLKFIKTAYYHGAPFLGPVNMIVRPVLP